MSEQIEVARRGDEVVLTVYRPDGSEAATIRIDLAAARRLAAMLRAVSRG